MSDKYPISPTWNLADTFTVQQAASLIAGFEPHAVSSNCGCFLNDGWGDTEGIEPARAAYTILTNAITDRTLKATIRHEARVRGFDEYPNDSEYGRLRSFDEALGLGDLPADHVEGVIYKRSPDWSKTTIRRQDLADWLKARGMTTGFFFPDASDTPAATATGTPDYLNPDHPHYTPKLAAAVKAWQALADREITRKSVKQALERWLRDNARALELMKDDGSPNYTAIDEIAKVTNWNPKGGAPKTPA